MLSVFLPSFLRSSSVCADTAAVRPNDSIAAVPIIFMRTSRDTEIQCETLEHSQRAFWIEVALPAPTFPAESIAHRRFGNDGAALRNFGSLSRAVYVSRCQ